MQMFVAGLYSLKRSFQEGTEGSLASGAVWYSVGHSVLGQDQHGGKDLS
jgi:hypothetical protein